MAENTRFSLGASSGLLGLQGKFDTVAGEKSLKHFQDAKKSLSKLNEVTIGAFNDKSTSAPVANQTASTEGAQASELTEEQKNDLIEKAAKTLDQKNGNDASADLHKFSVDTLKTQYENGEISAEELTAMADAYQPTLSDYLDQGLSAASDCFNQVVDDMKDNFCAAAPFAACASCSKRPKNKKIEIPDILGIIGYMIKSLQKGLEDAALALIGCPGLVQGVKTGLLTGNFDGLTNGIMAGAESALINTAVKTGASALFGGLTAIMPTDMSNFMKDKVGGMLKNSGSGGYDDICATMTGLAIAGDGLMKVASYAKDGNILGAYSALTNGSRRSSRYNLRTSSGFNLTSSGKGTLYAREPGSITSLFTKSASSCLTSAKNLTSAVSCDSIRTRARFSSSKISKLPGTTIPQASIKRAYAIDFLRTSRKTPLDVRVRKPNSICRQLFGR